MTTTQLNNVDVLRTITVNQAYVDAFSASMKSRTGYTLARWPAKAGSRPTDTMLTAAVLYSTQRKSGAESMFLAMQLRPEGASLSELSLVFDAGPAHNHTRDCERAGYLTRSKGGGRFMATFTPKGQKALEKLVAGMATAAVTDEPAKKAKAGKAKPGKATSGARKGKATPTADKPVEVPATDVQAVQAEIAAQAADQQQPATA